MKYTNKHKLPITAVDLLIKDEYDYNDDDRVLSTTTLLGSPQIALLGKKYRKEIKKDVSDMVWTFLGNAVHKMLEETELGKTEERLSQIILGYKITGKFDLIINKELWDYKVTTVYKTKNGFPKEWEEQLNIYHWLASKNGIQLKDNLRVFVLLRDWSKREALRKESYPQAGALILKTKKWNLSKTEQFIADKIKRYDNMRFGRIKMECTDEERWVKPQQFVVKKKNAKRAYRIFTDKLQAEELLKKMKGYELEVRPKEFGRCELYCDYKEYCKQYQEEKKEKNEKENN